MYLNFGNKIKMNSKTLELLEKFVGEEDNEELDNLGEKINILEEKTNDNKQFDNDLLDNNDDIKKLFEKINNLESKEVKEKNNEIDDNDNTNSIKENEENNDIINQNEKNKSEKLLKFILKKEYDSKLINFEHWKNLALINEKNDIIKDNNSIEKENNKYDNNVENQIDDLENNNINEKEEIQNEDIKNNINENDTSLNQILQNKEEDIEEHTQSEIITQHQNQLLKSDTNNFHINNSFTQIDDINLDNIFSKNKEREEPKSNNTNNISKNIIALSLYNIIEHKLYSYRKILFSVLKHKTIISNYYDKLYQLDKLNKKYEAILDEKSSIIINKTDEMEEMKEKIEKLSKSLKEANKKNKNLNVIQESLCAKCGGSLEESFTGDIISENQKIIKEQNDAIEMLKKELNELKSKYNLSEIKVKDLTNIKKEFENLSGSLLKPKNDMEVQTDDSLMPKQINSISKNENSNNSNINIQIYNNNINTNNKNLNISNTKKGSKKKNIPKKINFSNSSNNYMSNSSGHNKIEKTDTNSNKNDNSSEINNEILTSLRFDNSVLSNELLNLNREFNKLRNEHKVLSEKNIKLDKEKKDLLEKLKQKTEQSDKYKKENDEITRMINNTKYKNIINAETENKKLKNILEQNDADIKKLKSMNEKCAKKILEQNNQIEKMKTALGSLLNFKQQKEKLIIENKNYENELNKIKSELNEEKEKNEKNEVLINSKDKEIEKLANEVKYYSFHIKKYKSDAERALEDAIGYQKIVRILEVQLNQYKEQIDKIKNIKQDE